MQKEFTTIESNTFFSLANIFQTIKKKDLGIYFRPNTKRHFITWDKAAKKYLIFTDPLDEDIDRKTAFEHEVSHYLFDSPIESLKQCIDKIIVKAPDNLKPIARKAAHAIGNILEDQRIEGGLGKIQEGSRKRFIKTRTHLGLKKTEVRDPINALLACRFNRNDLAINAGFTNMKKYLDKAETLDAKGIIYLSKKFFDNEALPYLEKLDQNNLPKDCSMSEERDPDMPKPERQDKEDSDSDDKEDSDSDSSDSDDKEDSDSDDKEDSDSDSSDSDKIDSDRSDQKPFTGSGMDKDELEKSLDSLLDSCDHSEFKEPKKLKVDLKNINEELKKSQVRSQKEIEELRNKFGKLLKLNDQKFKPLDQRSYDLGMLNERQLEQRERMPIIDQGVATKLSLMFKDVYAKQSQYLDRHGDTLNTEAFLQGRRSHDYKIFDNDRLDQGLTFYILTDMSGSMGENVLLCSDIVATFFKAVEHLPKIKIKAFGFTNSIHDLDLISVAKRSECHKLGHAMGGTPTHYALREIKKHMQKDSSKKFLIVLTDGSPNSFGYEARRKLKLKVSPEQYCCYLVQSIKKMHVGIFGLMLGFDDYKMKQIFNDDYTSCNTMIEVKDKMISLLQKQINIFLSG